MTTNVDLLLQAKSVLIDTANALQAALAGAGADPVLQNEIWHALDDVEAEISRIKRAILAIVGGSLVLAPPTPSMIQATQTLCTQVEAKLQGAAQVAAVVSLIGTLSGAVDKVLKKPST